MTPSDRSPPVDGRAASSLLEDRIRFAAARFAAAKDLTDRRIAWAELTSLHTLRDSDQVLAMERARGLR